jgi:subtilisin family serine protease
LIFSHKIFFILLLLSTVVLAGIEKLDPRLGRIALSTNIERSDPTILRKIGTTTFIRAIITTDGDLRELRNAGVRIIHARDDMAIVDIPPAQLVAVSDLPSVVYMEAPRSNTAQLNESTKAIDAIKARSQRGATGKGAIVGIIDSGIDWRHHDFRHADGSTRIKYILDLSQAGPVYTGTVYTEVDINDALDNSGRVMQVDVSGHGTHVAGIAASDGQVGAGFGDYAGVAPEADLVIVKATRDAEGREFYTDDQIFALAFIDSVADILGKPWVANLSLGGHSGAHDGTSPVERYIDQLTGQGIQGKAVVTVAGNDGDVDVHAQTRITSSSEKAKITFHISTYTANAGTGNDIIVFDGWYDGDKRIGVTLTSPSGEKFGPVLPAQVFPNDGSAGVTSDDGTVYMWNGFYNSGNDYQPGANPHNGDREFYIQIDDTDNRRPAPGEWQIEFSGTGGSIDMWISNMSMDARFEQGNTETGKLTIPGTSRNSITVGSFISKKSWTDLDGNNLTFDSNGEFTVGDLSDFSSPGPVRQGGYQKPNIAAPGQIVASSMSAQASQNNAYSIFNANNPKYPNALVNEDGDHGLNSGTSMAAPHVTGAVALLLAEQPDLTAIQIRDILEKSADRDTQTGSVPNDFWGFGKLNIYDALQLTPEDEEPSMLKLFPPAPNPFNGRTRISYEIPQVENNRTTEIVVYNAMGQKVRTLVKDVKNTGQHDVYWDGLNSNAKPVASGVYFITMTFGSSKQVKKIVFLGTE